MSVHSLSYPWANESQGVYEKECLNIVCPILERNGYKLLYNCSSDYKRSITILNSYDVDSAKVEKLFKDCTFRLVEPVIEPKLSEHHNIRITFTFAKNERWTWGLKDPASYSTEPQYYETYF